MSGPPVIGRGRSTLTHQPRGWVERAACGDANPDLFTSDQPSSAVLRIAAKFCAVCPVRAECLADAEANGFTGVWGGIHIGPYNVRRQLLPQPPKVTL